MTDNVIHRPGTISRDQQTDSEVIAVFPGQGSQYPGMGRDLLRCPYGASLIDRAAGISGLPLDDLMTRAGAEALADPAVAQLSVLVHSLTLLRQLEEQGVTPDAVAGHSLGEYTAMVAAGMLDIDTAITIVAQRGWAMADAAAHTPGAMGAIVGLSADRVGQLCRQAAAHPVGIANINSARQLVISGVSAGVRDVLERSASASALRAKQLRVGGAYHSPLMDPAAVAMRDVWNTTTLMAPDRLMISSVTGGPVSDPDSQVQRMKDQISAPVDWLTVQSTLRAATKTGSGSVTVVEVGPGRTLTGLAREERLPVSSQQLKPGVPWRPRIVPPPAAAGAIH